MNWLSEITHNGFRPDDSGILEIEIDALPQVSQNKELAQQLIKGWDFHARNKM
jgi:hypothetical protein